MSRALLVACVLFVGCDQRVDELLAAGIQAALEEPPPSKRKIVCREGAAALPLAGGTQMTVHCVPWQVDGGAR